MTGAEIELIIGANTDQAIAALKKLGYQIKQTEQAAGKFAQKGKTDFTALGQVIQDLPFGFIAIQNNITRLVPSAGGLGIAISVLSAAFTFAQVGLSNWTRGFKAAKEEMDAMSKSVAGAQTEIQKVSSLLSVARDLTQSTETRKNAIAELQKEYPGYLKNLTLENVNSQETANAVNLLAGALTRKAKVQAISNLLTAANEKLLKAESTTIAENILSVNAFLGLLKSGGSLGAGSGVIAGATKETVDNISDAKKEVQQLSQTLAGLTADQARNADFSLLSPTAPKKLKDVADSFRLINTNIKGIKEKFIGAIAVETGDATAPIQKELDKNPLQFSFKPPELSEEDKKRMQEFTNMVGGMVQGGFEAIGETLGGLLSGKNNPFAVIFEFLGSSLIKLGTYVIAASQLLSKVTAALTAALSGFGGAGLAVGIGLIALGSILKNIPKFATGGVVTKPTLALVGEQGPERITPLGYEGRASNVMQGEVIFQISGQSLRGILRRADQTAFNTF